MCSRVVHCRRSGSLGCGVRPAGAFHSRSPSPSQPSPCCRVPLCPSSQISGCLHCAALPRSCVPPPSTRLHTISSPLFLSRDWSAKRLSARLSRRRFARDFTPSQPRRPIGSVTGHTICLATLHPVFCLLSITVTLYLLPPSRFQFISSCPYPPSSVHRISLVNHSPSVRLSLVPSDIRPWRQWNGDEWRQWNGDEWRQWNDDELIKFVDFSRTLTPVHFALSHVTYLDNVVKEKWSPATLLRPGNLRTGH